ncbi:MAG: hypothetical protein MZV70_58975 [Desulfobacterales bacterium]|nr:hypothetical protein [Desulfobacterales bacterium]
MTLLRNSVQEDSREVPKNDVLHRYSCLLALSTIIVPCADAGADGWHWRNPLPQGNNLYGVTHGNDIFAAVGFVGNGNNLTRWNDMDAEEIRRHQDHPL